MPTNHAIPSSECRVPECEPDDRHLAMQYIHSIDRQSSHHHLTPWPDLNGAGMGVTLNNNQSHGSRHDSASGSAVSAERERDLTRNNLRGVVFSNNSTPSRRPSTSSIAKFACRSTPPTQAPSLAVIVPSSHRYLDILHLTDSVETRGKI